MIDKTEKKFLDYRSFFLGQSTLGNAIEKRQAMLITGIAMSAAALYESFELDATIDEVNNRQNVLVRHVDSLTDDMKTTVRNVKRRYGAIFLMKANSLSQSAIISLESAVLEMTTDSQRFFSGLDNLLNHKLSMEIVDNIDMKAEFNGLQDALRGEGFEMVFQSMAQVYQLPATFVVINSTVTAIVKIPVIQNGDVQNFHLFQHLRLPVLHDRHLVEVTSAAEMIAIDSDRSEFVSLTGSEVHACTRMGVQFLCPFVSLASQSGPKDCLKAIFLGDSKSMKMSCQIRFLQDKFLMRRVNDAAFLVFATSEVTISITCHLDTRLLKASNMNIVNISPGCTCLLYTSPSPRD